jgi:hypothetical protein
VEYVPYEQLDGRPNVIVDGSPTEGTVLTVTHWPGYPPPEPLCADLSAQMAFQLLEHQELLAGAELVSNNHFDQDGLVSIFALVDPDGARQRRAVLEDVAAAGDFATYTIRDAARVSMVLAAVATGRGDLDLPDEYGAKSALLYTELVDRLPQICDDIDRWAELWADEDAALTASERAIAAGDVTITEDPDVDLAVVDVLEAAPATGGHRFGHQWSTGLHPMAVNNATERFVVATVRSRSYQVEQRYESWVQYRSRPLRLRRDLVPLAGRLQAEEGGDATWSATPVSGLTPRLSSGEGGSSIDRRRFVELLTDHLRTAPVAWDPFVSR